MSGQRVNMFLRSKCVRITTYRAVWRGKRLQSTHAFLARRPGFCSRHGRSRVTHFDTVGQAQIITIDSSTLMVADGIRAFLLCREKPF